MGWRGKNGNLIGKEEVGPTETPGKGEEEINERNLGGWSSNRRIRELGNWDLEGRWKMEMEMVMD